MYLFIQKIYDSAIFHHLYYKLYIYLNSLEYTNKCRTKSVHF